MIWWTFEIDPSEPLVFGNLHVNRGVFFGQWWSYVVLPQK